MTEHPVEQLQPCGHPMSAIESSDEGTAHCVGCQNNWPINIGDMPATFTARPPKYGPNAEHNAMPRRIDAHNELVDAALAFDADGHWAYCRHEGGECAACTAFDRLSVAADRYREVVGDA